jgi:multidrug resistance efflux pump
MIIKVTFESGPKLYAYQCPYDVEVGQKVIVDSPSMGYVVVEVAEVDVEDDKATKRVVNTIDDTDYKNHLNKLERTKQIKAKLEQKKKEVEELYIWEMLAEKDDDAKALLDELKSL